MSEMMTFPDDWHDFLNSYSFTDSKETYSNKCRLIHVFRVEQLIEHLLAEREHKWISVKDRLPEQEKTVIVARKYVLPGSKETRYVETAELIGNEWVSVEDVYKINRQFHTIPYAWMPLPEPPKEDDDGRDDP